MTRWAAGAFGALLFLVACARTASAQAESAAERLFAEGRALQARGREDEACLKFEASVAAEPAVGSLLNVATCAERVGHTATAWSRYREAAALASSRGDAEREAVARRAAALIEPRVPKLLLRLPAETPASALVVKRDGLTLRGDEIHTPMPVDPGPHAFEVSGPGARTWTNVVVAPATGGLVVVDVPRQDAASAPALEPGKREPRSAEHEPAAPDARPLAWAAGGVAIAALAVGGYFALRSRATWSDVTARCPDARCADAATAAALEPKKDDAQREAMFGTVGLAVGAASLAASAILFVLVPPRARAALLIDPGGRRDVGLRTTVRSW